MKRILTTALAILAGGFFTSAAQAQEVTECDWRASAWNLAEPWQANSRTFANGKTRLALVDTGEPAAGSFYILILSPPYDELGGRQCRLVGAGDGLGFFGLNFTGLQAQYDPAIGLGFAIPGQSYAPESLTGGAPIYLLITLNQATGAITAQVQPTGG